VAADITAARALAIGTTARDIAVRRLRAAGVTEAETVATTATGEAMAAETGVVMADHKRADRKAAGRHSHRRAILAGRRQRPPRRLNSRVGLYRMSVNLFGVSNRRNSPSTTTRSLWPRVMQSTLPELFQGSGRLFIVCTK
jgi:hypothetical protein